MPKTLTQLDQGQAIRSAYNDANKALDVSILGTLVPENFDEIDLGYTGSDLTTVTYKLAGTTVATLTLTYGSGLLTKVVRS